MMLRRESVCPECGARLPERPVWALSGRYCPDTCASAVEEANAW